ncbi:hypothetical protein Bcep18194_B0994 [Burkholderia lata]|uniref:Uncharacterized protein n=1 Tax=Burkholderia lata (strain ATCC 17760 / DSM 23089 / LMG 22485 / NCIMB 9086 / R18194 / 383) TaxID=482957 RepID=Q398K3_BURL3|nr:hypothetical protein Bcep18194_B0994 [Burkholderia lata]
MSRSTRHCKGRAPSLLAMARPAHVIRLPQHLRKFSVVEGDPDLFGTRCISFATALLCMVACLGLGATSAIDDRIQWTFELAIVLIALFVSMAASAIVMTREGIKAGAWFHVDQIGLWYGTGKLSDSNALSAGRRILWDEIVGKPDAGCDVRTEYQTSRSFTKNFVFWRRLATGEIVEQRIPMRLTSNAMRCIRFRNRDALIVAILRGLAGRGLRFDLDVFVDAGVHPETWRPMKRPRRMLNLLYAASSLLSAWFVMQCVLTWPVWATIGGMVVVFSAAIFLGYVLWVCRYRDLTGIVCFEAHASTTPHSGKSR